MRTRRAKPYGEQLEAAPRLISDKDPPVLQLLAAREGTHALTLFSSDFLTIAALILLLCC
jgi:hypothetical protein